MKDNTLNDGKETHSLFFGVGRVKDLDCLKSVEFVCNVSNIWRDGERCAA